MLPAGFDIDDLDLAGLDLTQGDDIKKLLGSLPINVIDTTFKLTDTPGSWFDSGLQLFGGKSLGGHGAAPGGEEPCEVRRRSPTPGPRRRTRRRR